MTEPPVALPDAVRMQRIVVDALEEDGVANDLTTRALISEDQRAIAKIVAKEEGVLAGVPVARAVYAALDGSLHFEALCSEGGAIAPEAVVARLSGQLTSILTGERVALNFLQRLSGVATITRRMVEAVDDLPVQILDTRKTTPGLRELERYAVRVGGGTNHRFNLSDAVLIKDNHLAALRLRERTIADALAGAKRAAPRGAKLMIEVTCFAEAKEALEAGARWLLLDNMGTQEMRDVVGLARSHPDTTTEASGGVTLANVRAIAETGVNAISVGALTHSAPALDLSLKIEIH